MAASKETRKCARCKHPWNKHTAQGGSGCTVKRFGPSGGGPVYCSCRAFVERVK